jgi:hypothetical protein
MWARPGRRTVLAGEGKGVGAGEQPGDSRRSADPDEPAGAGDGPDTRDRGTSQGGESGQAPAGDDRGQDAYRMQLRIGCTRQVNPVVPFVVRNGQIRGDHGAWCGHPRWFGSTGTQPAQILSLFGRDGERMHVRAATPGEDKRCLFGPWPRVADIARVVARVRLATVTGVGQPRPRSATVTRQHTRGVSTAAACRPFSSKARQTQSSRPLTGLR